MTHQFWKNAPLALFILLQCGLGLLLLQAGARSTENDATQPANLVVSMEGQASVKRKGWSNYASVAFGTNLRPGDLLRIDESSRVKVVCSDLTLHDLLPGIVGVPCVASQPLLLRADGSMIDATRSWPSDGSFPLVLSPRMTKLLSPHPVLRWTPVKGATDYRVIVRGMNFYWSRVYHGTEITYPDTAPPLAAGVDYKFIVETIGPNSRSSSEEPGLGLGFTLLDSKVRKTVEEEERRIRNLGLPESTTQFLVAHLYTTHRLNAEAIQRLEDVSKTFKVAAVARLLGDLYFSIGLPRQAEANYLNSLSLSMDGNDEEGEMLVHLALARIYGPALGNVKSATEHLDAALVLAKKLGDDNATTEVGKRLADLKGTGT